ncbi:MAG: hypothetical protein KIG13_02300 [Eubacteriales bacterium]|nr:hypothetical protein [Eubacteriales bacterium]
MNNKNCELIALASAIIGTYSEFNPYDYVDFKAVSNFSTLKVNFQNPSKKEILKTENKKFGSFPKNKNFKVSSFNRTADDIREL